MIRIPAGTHRALYATSAQTVAVAAFSLDVDPVTRGDFLEFVRANTRWSRDAFASGGGGGYLADWRTADDPGTAIDGRRPVTNVTLHAARAYCAERGKRLPTKDEWEYAATASETRRDAAADPAFVQRLVSLYANRPNPLPPVERGERNFYGVRGLHGLAWEWVHDIGRGADAEHTHENGGKAHDAYCASAAIGASDPNNYPAFLRLAVRSGLTDESTMGTLGFRCAK